MEIIIGMIIIASAIGSLLAFTRKNKPQKKNYDKEQNKTEEERLKYLNKRIFASNFGLASKGETGENFIERELYKLSANKKIIRNAYIPYKDGTAEIDIIMITECGIYVIESKNYSGWIFGSENQTYWTQSLNKNSKYKFYNPILQNKNHVNALSKYLNINTNYFKSYIVFSSNSELKKVPQDTAYFKILYDYKIYEYINFDIQHGNKIIDTEYMEQLYKTLLPTTNVSEEVKQEHIKQTQQYK